MLQLLTVESYYSKTIETCVVFKFIKMNALQRRFQNSLFVVVGSSASVKTGAEGSILYLYFGNMLLLDSDPSSLIGQL